MRSYITSRSAKLKLLRYFSLHLFNFFLSRHLKRMFVHIKIIVFTFVDNILKMNLKNYPSYVLSNFTTYLLIMFVCQTVFMDVVTF